MGAQPESKPTQATVRGEITYEADRTNRIQHRYGRLDVQLVGMSSCLARLNRPGFGLVHLSLFVIALPLPPLYLFALLTRCFPYTGKGAANLCFSEPKKVCRTAKRMMARLPREFCGAGAWLCMRTQPPRPNACYTY